jgi:hypothetical protein
VTTTTTAPATTTTVPPTTTTVPRPTAGLVGTGGAFTVRDGALIPLPAPAVGSTGAPISASSATASGEGAWAADTTGRVYVAGDARFLGDLRAVPLNRPINGMAPTPTGNGYWLVASDGGIFAYGDAQFFGSTGAIRLNKPITGMAPTAGQGLLARRQRRRHLRLRRRHLLRLHRRDHAEPPITGMASTSTGTGYWLVASDGGIFAYGDATFQAALPLVCPP